MAVFAAYRSLGEGDGFVFAGLAGYWLRTAAVAVDAARLDDAVEAEVAVLVAGGKIPFRGLGVVRERGLKEIVAAPQQRAKPFSPVPMIHSS